MSTYLLSDEAIFQAAVQLVSRQNLSPFDYAQELLEAYGQLLKVFRPGQAPIHLPPEVQRIERQGLVQYSIKNGWGELITCEFVPGGTHVLVAIAGGLQHGARTSTEQPDNLFALSQMLLACYLEHKGDSK